MTVPWGANVQYCSPCLSWTAFTIPSESANPPSDPNGPLPTHSSHPMLKSPMTTNATPLFFASIIGISRSWRSLRNCTPGSDSIPVSLPLIPSIRTCCLFHVAPPLLGAYTWMIATALFHRCAPSSTTPAYLPHPLVSCSLSPTLALHAELTPSPTPPSGRSPPLPRSPLSPWPWHHVMCLPPHHLPALSMAFPAVVLTSTSPLPCLPELVPTSANPAKSAPIALMPLKSMCWSSNDVGPDPNLLRFRVVTHIPFPLPTVLTSSPAHSVPSNTCPTVPLALTLPDVPVSPYGCSSSLEAESS